MKKLATCSLIGVLLGAPAQAETGSVQLPPYNWNTITGCGGLIYPGGIPVDGLVRCTHDGGFYAFEFCGRALHDYVDLWNRRTSREEVLAFFSDKKPFFYTNKKWTEVYYLSREGWVKITGQEARQINYWDVNLGCHYS